MCGNVSEPMQMTCCILTQRLTSTGCTISFSKFHFFLSRSVDHVAGNVFPNPFLKWAGAFFTKHLMQIFSWNKWLNSNNWERLKIYCFQVVNGYSQEWCQEVSGHIIKWLRHVDLQQVPDVPAFVIHHLLHPTNSLITQRRRLIRGGSAANSPFKGLVCSGLSWFTRVRM